MIFPITNLLSEQESLNWIARHFHPQGLKCPQCQADQSQARQFRRSRRGVMDYRCKQCGQVYNLYSGTVFARSLLSPRQVILLLRGVCKGETSVALAAELGIRRATVHELRKKL